MNAGVLFSGFGGVEVGLRNLGINTAWGIEHDDNIAAVAIANGFNTLVADVSNVDYSQYEYVDILHASPPCKTFTQMKSFEQQTETDTDTKNARAIRNAIMYLRPKYFTLENAPKYSQSEAFQSIVAELMGLGYTVKFEVQRADHYGVAQMRRRLILRACLTHNVGQMVTLPNPGWGHHLKDVELEQRDGPYPSLERLLTDGVTLPDICAVSSYFNHLSTFYPEKRFPTITTKSNKYLLQMYGNWYNTPTELLKLIQTFPKDYWIPKPKGVARTGIGNALPPTWYQQIISSLVKG